MAAHLISLALLSLSPATAAPLHDLVKAQIPISRQSAVSQQDGPSSFERFVPIQRFQFQLGADNDDVAGKSSGHSKSGDFRNSFRIRADIKSYEEIFKTGESRRLSDLLAQSSRSAALNQARFEQYTGLVSRLLDARLSDLLKRRLNELQKSLDRSSHRLGQQKFAAKDLVADFRRIQSVETEYAAVRSRNPAEPKADETAAVENLVEEVQETLRRVLEFRKQAPDAPLAAKDTELRLEKLHREIKTADQNKLIDNIEYGQSVDNANQRDETFRITFNVPLLRFDRENENREKALLRAKELELEKDRLAVQQRLSRDLDALASLAKEVQSLRDRAKASQSVIDRLKGVRDVDLQANLADYRFELERDILNSTRRYYVLYLECLRDMQAFSALDVNFLDGKWIGLDR